MRSWEPTNFLHTRKSARHSNYVMLGMHWFLLRCFEMQVSDRLLQLGVGLGGMLALVLLVADPIWPRTFTQVGLLWQTSKMQCDQ